MIRIIDAIMKETYYDDEDYIIEYTCPSSYGYTNVSNEECYTIGCEKCWKREIL